MAIDCVVVVKAGKRTYRVPLAGGLPSDSPTVAEKSTAGVAALAAVTASHGNGYSCVEAEPDWSTAVAQSVEWTKSANV